MASGYTTTTDLTDSLNTMVASARIVREYEGVMSQLVDKEILEDGTGLNWNEVSYAQLTAISVSETGILDNPQVPSDTNFQITPTVVGIHTVLTDRLKGRMSPKGYQKLGSLGANAIARKKDEDGITVLDGFTSLGGAGVTLSTGYIAAAKVAASSNATEPAKPPFRCALHGFQIKDLQDELLSGVGTYPVGEGPTAKVLREGFRLPVVGVEVYEDGNITIDSSNNAKGGVFPQEGIVLVTTRRSPWRETRREPAIGGGADSVWLYEEYAYGERSSGNWGRELYSDATAPTS